MSECQFKFSRLHGSSFSFSLTHSRLFLDAFSAPKCLLVSSPTFFHPPEKQAAWESLEMLLEIREIAKEEIADLREAQAIAAAAAASAAKDSNQSATSSSSASLASAVTAAGSSSSSSQQPPPPQRGGIAGVGVGGGGANAASMIRARYIQARVCQMRGRKIATTQSANMLAVIYFGPKNSGRGSKIFFQAKTRYHCLKILFLSLVLSDLISTSVAWPTKGECHRFILVIGYGRRASAIVHFRWECQQQ